MIFKKEAGQYIQSFCAEMQQFPWEDKEAYANWLSQTYHYVCHSTRLLALAASRFEDAKLHGRFLEHLGEEKGHEKLATHDLKHLGAPVGECYPETHAFYMTQYYYLEHTPPAAFLGWILCLEGMAATVGNEIYNRVKAAHGEKAGAFCKVHAGEDIGHLEKAYGLLDRVSPADAATLLENMKVSVGLYAGLLRACAEQARRAGKKAA
jgi:thiaminase